MERSMTSGEKNELWNIANEAYNRDTEADVAESWRNEKREQEIAKITEEKAAEEN
jgi:hypothetical protein